MAAEAIVPDRNVKQRSTRPAVPPDARRIATIYNEGMADRTATFETTERDEQAILAWFDLGYPIHVATADDEVMAYAVAFPSSSRPCYEGVREFSVYVARSGRGQGFGAQAMEALLADCTRRGWWKLMSRVFPENMASRRLLNRLGFREIGLHERHAKLDGFWRDVLVVEKLLD